MQLYRRTYELHTLHIQANVNLTLCSLEHFSCLENVPQGCGKVPNQGLCLFPSHRPLHVAARNGLTVVVQELLGKGASVLAVDENGEEQSW